jgi:hypothetical protein
MRHKDQAIPHDPPPDSGEAGEILVECPHEAGDALRLVTLSWSIPRRGGDLLDPEDFLTTLDQLRGRHPEPWDMLLASGRTLSSEPSPREIRSRTGGSPILFEVINDRGSTARWLLTHGDSEAHTKQLRSEQILFRRGDEVACYDRLSSVLGAGGGVLSLRGRRTRLVLLICGENNALNTSWRGLSTLCHPGPGLTRSLGHRWVALNPAHSPYWPQKTRMGFAKVGQDGGVGPTMSRSVARRTPYPDGTSPPLAFVHANNFFADEPRTTTYASVAFGPAGRLAPEWTVEDEFPAAGGGGSLRWLAASYRILARSIDQDVEGS